MQATTRFGIPFADVNDPQRINDITAAMAAGIDNAIDSAYRLVQPNATALLALPTSGFVQGKSRAFTTAERLEWVWSGSTWIVVGGAMPLVALGGAAVVAENSQTKIIPWANTYIGPSPTSMWVSGAPTQVYAPVAGIYLVQVMTRWPDAANVEIGLQKSGVAIAGANRQYGLRNAMISTVVSLTANQDLRVTCQSYSGSQALVASASSLSVSLIRSL